MLLMQGELKQKVIEFKVTDWSGSNNLVTTLIEEKLITVEPRYNKPRDNEDPIITNNIHCTKARQNYSKLCGNKPRDNG